MESVSNTSTPVSHSWRVAVACTVVQYLVLGSVLWRGDIFSQCWGLRGVLVLSVVVLILTPISIFYLLTRKPRLRWVKTMAVLVCAVAVLPSLIPVVLGLSGIHAGDNVCTVASSDLDYLPQPVELLSPSKPAVLLLPPESVVVPRQTIDCSRYSGNAAGSSMSLKCR